MTLIEESQNVINLKDKKQYYKKNTQKKKRKKKTTQKEARFRKFRDFVIN